MTLNRIVSFLLFLVFTTAPLHVINASQHHERIDEAFLHDIQNSEHWIPVILELKQLPGVEYWLDRSPHSIKTFSHEERSSMLKSIEPYEEYLYQYQVRFVQRARKNGIALIPKHHLTLTLNGFTGEIKGKDISKLLEMPQIYRIHDGRVEHQLMRRVAARTTGADLSWEGFSQSKIPPLAGSQQLIGIIDTGLDIEHKEFTRKDKVRGGFNFHDQNTDLSDAGMHGTHVAGIAAGQGGSPEYQGMAYDADLMVYKIFTKDKMHYGDVFGALEMGTRDQCTILNCSFGGASGESSNSNSVYHRAVKNADSAGVFVVAAAGNDGSRRKENPWTIATPSLYDESFSVAAATDRNEEPYIILNPGKANEQKIHSVHIPPTPAFSTSILSNGIVNAGYGLEEEIAFLNLRGRIALIQRGPRQGSISFREKIDNAHQAGARGVIIYNHTTGEKFVPDIFEKGENNLSLQHLPPSLFLSNEDGLTLLKSIQSSSSIKFENLSHNLIADFSSMGLTGNSSFKPEISAPGVDIMSTVPGNRYFATGGTSMASPVIAGLSALVKEARPEWSHEQIKSAFMNTADIMINPINQLPITFTLQGSGVARVDKALQTPAFIHPRAFVFSDSPNKIVEKVTLSNPHNIEQQFTLDAKIFHLQNDEPPIQISFDKNTITLDARGSASFNVMIKMEKKQFRHHKYEGIIEVGEDLHIPVIIYKGTGSDVVDVVSDIHMSRNQLEFALDPDEDDSNETIISFSLNAGSLFTFQIESFTIHMGTNSSDIIISVADEEGELLEDIGKISNLMVGSYIFYWDGNNQQEEVFLYEGNFQIIFRMHFREYEDGIIHIKPYEVFSYPFEVTSSFLPLPVPASYFAPKIIEGGENVKVGLRFHQLVSLFSHDTQVSALKFQFMYDPSMLMYLKYEQRGLLSAKRSQVQIFTDIDESLGIISFEIFFDEVDLKELNLFPLLEIHFEVENRGRITFGSQRFFIKTQNGDQIRVKASTPQIRISTRSFLLSDINGDRVVDRHDFEIFNQAYGSRRNEPFFDERCDINQDGIIDMLDLEVLGKEMGRSI